MNILVIDDQSNVVNGIVFGVDWKRIDVNKVFKAYNAYEAKEIIMNYQVDIMLCDIEMPVESGLDLFRWVKEQKKEIECIFLTAHADFMYAKEAMKLGGFDYIVQPARYSDIEEAVVRAKKKIKAKLEVSQYYSYGKMLYTEKDRFQNEIVKRLFSEKEKNLQEVLDILNKLKINIMQETQIYQAIFEIYEWETIQEKWESELIQYLMNNIANEFFKYYGQNAIVSVLECNLFAIILYPVEAFDIDKENLIRQLEKIRSAVESILKCDIACYTGNKLLLKKSANNISRLLKYKKDNVGHICKVHFIEDDNNKIQYNIKLPDMKLWSKLILSGCSQSVCEEGIEYLDNIVENESINAIVLKKFYQEFMKMVYRVAQEENLSVDEIFTEDMLEQSFSFYQDIESMKHLIKFITAYFNKPTSDFKNNKNQMENIKQYIYEHLDEEIKRSDIAEAVFLNPNYISRLFKIECGMSLKEFIVQEKMKMAKALLRTTNLPISIVALRVGYTNFSHFSQVYKKTIGITPTEERK